MKATSDIVDIIRQWMEGFTVRSMGEWTRYVRATGLSMPQFGLLMRLYYEGGCGVHNISDRMEISSAAASQLVERLVQSGLVERTEDPADRRARQIALSVKGRALIDRGIEERYRWVDGLVAGLAGKNRAAVLKALPLLIEAEKKLPRPKNYRASLAAIRKLRKRP